MFINSQHSTSFTLLFITHPTLSWPSLSRLACVIVSIHPALTLPFLLPCLIVRPSEVTSCVTALSLSFLLRHMIHSIYLSGSHFKLYYNLCFRTISCAHCSFNLHSPAILIHFLYFLVAYVSVTAIVAVARRRLVLLIL